MRGRRPTCSHRRHFASIARRPDRSSCSPPATNVCPCSWADSTSRSRKSSARDSFEPRADRCLVFPWTGRGVLIGLLERETEVASLGELVRDAAAGAARLAFVEGPAGIGKTRLVAEARRDAAEAGLRVLWARGGELEREFPFGVVRQLFEPALLNAAERTLALEGAAAAARPVFQAVDGGDASFAVLHGLPLLADREPELSAAAAARRRRPALVRPAVAALPRLPRAAPRGTPGARHHVTSSRGARYRHGAARGDRRRSTHDRARSRCSATEPS